LKIIEGYGKRGSYSGTGKRREWRMEKLANSGIFGSLTERERDDHESFPEFLLLRIIRDYF